MLVWFFLSTWGLNLSSRSREPTHPQRSVAVAIAVVICVFIILVVILAVTQFVVQHRLPTILHAIISGLLEQILDVIRAVDACHLQQFASFLFTYIFFQDAIFSGHMLSLQYGASIRYHTGGLHKVCYRPTLLYFY